MQSQPNPEIMSYVYAIYKKCRTYRTDEQENALITRLEAQRKKQEQAAFRRREVESARARDGWFRKMVERAVADHKENQANGLVEVKILPGPRWTPEWWESICRFRVPKVNPDALPLKIGVNALLFAIERYETKRKQNPRVSAAGIVHREALAVMFGQRTQWVSPSIAAQAPQHTIRGWQESYAGRMWLLYHERLKRVAADPGEMKRRGLAPFPGSAVLA